MRAIRRADPETERRWLEQVRAIATEVLAPYDVDLYLFGSRARGEAKEASDIDLALDPRGELRPSVLARLDEQFDESTVPVKVEVVDLRSAGEEFRAKALREGIRWIASKSA
ncbi:MAG: nucleotidyltransferase domain-containing protein [Planctomycetes bacterium]|nr:nucleotidyltransferase domain-containing protein [Planctomycetota bacterium]